LRFTGSDAFFLGGSDGHPIPVVGHMDQNGEDGNRHPPHLEGILNYCRTKVPLGMVEAINGNIKCLLRRGRGYKNLHYLLLKAQRMAATRTEFVVFRKAA